MKDVSKWVLLSTILVALAATDAWADGIGGAYHDGRPVPVDPGDSVIDRISLSTLNPNGVLVDLAITYDPLGLARLIDITSADAALMAPGHAGGSTNYGIPAEGVQAWRYELAPANPNSTLSVGYRYDIPAWLTPEIAESYSEPHGRGPGIYGMYFIEFQARFLPIGEPSAGLITIVQGVNWISAVVVSDAPPPVPEPATWALVSLGASGLILLRRRRSRAQQA